MKLSEEDQQLLGELCSQNDVNLAKVQKLLETVYDYEFKERRTGIYDALREIIKNLPVDYSAD
ncbi:MAG: DNA modification system-associated small protein [Desulfobacteraceae bacterium]